LAGVAAPGRQVRAYIGDILLGQTNASPAGRVLIEAELDIPVGDHVVHIEELEPDGVTAAGASVHFRREPGASMAAIATTAPDAATSGPLRSDSGAAVSAVSERLAPKLQHVEGAVIIRRGDTLWRISHRVYGRGVRYSTIYLANQTQISNPNRIWPGQVFNIPERSREGEVANLKALGKQAAQTSMP
jgi:nucleoid-associated protein YgaU